MDGPELHITPGALAVFLLAQRKMREPSGEACPRCGAQLDMGEVLTRRCRSCGRVLRRGDDHAGDDQAGDVADDFMDTPDGLPF